MKREKKIHDTELSLHNRPCRKDFGRLFFFLD